MHFFFDELHKTFTYIFTVTVFSILNEYGVTVQRPML